MRYAVVLLVFLPLLAVGQEKFHGFYANAKTGIGNWFEHDPNVGVSLEGGLVHKRNLYSFSYLRTEEIDNREVVNSFDVMLGRFVKK